ncbi:hypothetical protein [Flavobacterium sp. LM4]|uniref:hypothetical protein n=1 Tax=Flavobacterium sp. LM4 TaxID=1938609 RepID=UPI000993B791|nr:hypothetical protein [Flavobacterium sp. LM4]OOV19875.1 hypothetical protein BXU10_09660 [Flavobacterium sp. LM4]
MKKVIFLSVLISILSCKKTEDKSVENKVLLEVPKEIEVKTDEKEIELPEYSLIKKEDISIKTSMDANAVTNKRFTYKYLVAKTITKTQIPLLLTKLIENIVQKDNDIDDVTVWLYSDKNLIDGSYDVAMATFKPSNGEVTNEIASNNDKSSYVANFEIANNFGEGLDRESNNTVVSGLSFDLRKKIYKELANTETRAREKLDKIYPYTANFDTDNYANKLDELTKKYEKEISKKYKINAETVKRIYEEGDKNEWYNY